MIRRVRARSFFQAMARVLAVEVPSPGGECRRALVARVIPRLLVAPLGVLVPLPASAQLPGTASDDIDETESGRVVVGSLEQIPYQPLHRRCCRVRRQKFSLSIKQHAVFSCAWHFKRFVPW